MTVASADPSYRLDIDGPGAPPRSNGELVFHAPWETRVFGLAMALVDRGVLDWETFRQALIGRIASFEVEPPGGEGWSYWDCWTTALSDVLTRGVLTPQEVQQRIADLSSRPAGHDHARDHAGGDEQGDLQGHAPA